MKNDVFLHVFFALFWRCLAFGPQIWVSLWLKCVRFNEREDYPVVVFHDGLSKASPVLRSSQSQKGVFSNFLVCLVMFLHLVSTDVEGLHFEPIIYTLW